MAICCFYLKLYLKIHYHLIIILCIYKLFKIIQKPINKDVLYFLVTEIPVYFKTICLIVFFV